MRNKFSDQLFKNASKDKKIYVVVADISPAGSMEKFRKKYPDRFVNVGVAEQSMVGIASGLALKGKKVFTYTIATFSLYRPFEMIRDNICYHNLPVTIVGMGAGTIYHNLGGTHMTVEDISVARSLPNFSVLSPADPYELEKCVDYCAKNKKSPIYLRIGKSGEKNFTQNSKDKWRFGKMRKVLDGKKICFISHGILIKYSVETAKKLKKIYNLNASVYSCHTLKPFDVKTLNKISKNNDLIISIEDHSEIGGLSSIIKEKLFENKFNGTLLTYSLKDKFINDYGSQKGLFLKHGISVKKILNDIKNSMNLKKTK